MNFPPTVYDALARREEYGHGVIHAVCRDFHLHTLRRLHTHLHRPRYHRDGYDYWRR